MKEPNSTEDQIVSLLHQEMSDAEKEVLQRRLQAEPEMQAMMIGYQRLDSALRGIPKKQTSDLFTDRMINKIAATKNKKSTSYIQTIGWVAAVIVSCAGIYLYQHSITSNTNPNTTAITANQILVTPKQNIALAELGALDWLSHAQVANGSWVSNDWGAKSQYTVGLSGLSLLAFASAINDTKKESYLNTIKKGCQFILSTQNQDGSFGPAISNRLYNQGIATVALFKASEIAPGLVPTDALKKSIAYILSCQNPTGGWGYFNANEMLGTYIFIWQVHRLILAKQYGLSNLEEPIKKNLAWLQQLSDKNGVVGYRKPNDFPFGQSALSAMSGIFWLYEDQISDSAIEYKIKFQDDLEKIALAPEKNLNYYQFYFLTSSLKKLKAKHQFRLAQKVEDVLVAKQIKTGKMIGSWEPNDCWGPTGGRIYSTAMATISLAALK